MHGYGREGRRRGKKLSRFPTRDSLVGAPHTKLASSEPKLRKTASSLDCEDHWKRPPPQGFPVSERPISNLQAEQPAWLCVCVKECEYVCVVCVMVVCMMYVWRVCKYVCDVRDV